MKNKKDFEKTKNCNRDTYSRGIYNTASLIIEFLDEKNMEPKDAWYKGMLRFPGHSGASAACVAITVVKFSKHGEDFKNWCIKDKIVHVEWK